MLYIDELCKDNNIEYYVIGATALGAVRHGGFIPWDDDLDIAMTRKNYNKFIAICRSEQFDSHTFFFSKKGLTGQATSQKSGYWEPFLKKLLNRTGDRSLSRTIR